MLISLNWLRDYVDITVAPERLADDLTMAGLNVEGLERRPNPFADLRIGRVLTCAKHPDADKLSVCTVDIGEERPRDIVCGAPNVREGLEVAVIPAGATLPDGTLIRKGKIRGAVSAGMICSEIELGLGTDAAGIMELDFDLAPGTPLSERFGEEDWILDVEVTPNRPDQLGYIGIAREVAAIYGGELRLPDATVPERALADLPPVPVDILDPEGCPRYVARRLESVAVGESPEWLKRRLAAMGLRPISNVVDITNFVMFETGQPLHAFDAERLAENRIVVRRAAAGEKTLTLDDDEVELLPTDLVIADAEKTVAIAGVMGCENSKVEETSGSLILESACFDPKLVRGTRRRLDLATDSAYRFERGADIDMVDWASRRATALFAELTGARAAAAPDDAYPGRREPKSVTLRLAKVAGLLGREFDAAEAGAILGRLGLSSRARGDALVVEIPAFRRDLDLEVDLIEEIARLYGYNELPAENRVRNTLHGEVTPAEKVADRAHALMTGLGFQEIVTSSFMDPGNLDRMGLAEDDPCRRLVTLRNPLVSFNATMRSSLLPGLLEVLKTNFHRGQEDLRLYELGRVYLRVDGEPLPEEPRQLALLITGSHSPAHWSLKPAQTGSADLVGVASALADELGLEATLADGHDAPWCVPGTGFDLIAGGETVGRGGLLRAALLEGLKQKREIHYFELLRLPRRPRAQRAFSPLPAFPSVRRDLALLVPKSLRWAEVEGAVRESGGKWLESQELFDVYDGEGVPDDAVSCAVRLSFRSQEGTLTDKQVDKQLQRVLKRLKESLQISLRS